MLELREYQRAAIDALYAYWGDGGGNGLLVLPTGSGKALVIAKLIEELLQQYPDMRIVNLTHSKTLVQQNFMEFIGLSPFAPAGIFSAGLGRKDRSAQVLFAGIQSIANKAHEIGTVDLILVDEAHAISRNADTQYGKFFKAVGEVNPDSRVAGLTATPYRLDSGRLDEGEDSLFDDVVYEIGIRDLIDAGYLSPLISKPGDVMIDMTGVSKRGGEYTPSEAERAADKEEITRAAVSQAIRMGQDRKAWLFFCSGQDHAEHVRDELMSQGVPAASLTSRTLGQDKIIADFKAGKLRALASANMLTTGFNVPHVDLISMLRATASTGLYVQICGRGTRLAGGKENCLVLDHAGNVARHGPVDMVNPKTPGKGGGEAPIRMCPECDEICHAAARVCSCCGFEFPPSEDVKITARPSDAPILSTDEPVWREVTGRTFRRHEKVGGLPSVRVDYSLGLELQKEWLCPQHTGFPKQRADRFWHAHGGLRPFPATVEQFLERAGELRITTGIRLKKNGKYWNVDGHQVGAEMAPANDNVPVAANDNAGRARLRALMDDSIPF